MMLIISHHYVVNSGLIAETGPIYSDPMSWRSLFLLVMGAWGKTGINCFVFITGFFMCKSNITLRKFIKLLFEILFYNVVTDAVFWITGYSDFSIIELAKALIPVRNVDTGFTSCFILFYLFIPFLNILVHNMTEKQHLSLIALTGFTYVFLGTMPFFSITMNYVSWFMVVYIIASYIRLYPKHVYENGKLWGWLTIMFIVLAIASVVCMEAIKAKYNKGWPYYFVTDSNTFLALAIAISSFFFFKSLRIENNRFINNVASTSFGVLLIHANSDTMRQWLWKDVVDCVGHYQMNLMPLYSVFSVVAIFAICSCIDWIRIKLIEIPCLKWYDRNEEAIIRRCIKDLVETRCD